ncbi:MAG: VirB4 family type IV secretion system protein [Acidimicrobiales bacterium]
MTAPLTRLLRKAGITTESPSAVLVGPDAVEVAARRVRLGDGFAATVAVTGYPREVGPGWLDPLLTHPGRLDVALHIDPVPAAVAADRLRRQRARLESARRMTAAKERLADPEVDVAAEDAADLAARLARGEGRLFRFGLYLTVHAESEAALGAELTRVRALCASLLLDAQPATWRQLQGWVTTLPVGVDHLGLRRSFDTAALAAAFPFATADLPGSGTGVLYGRAARGGGLVCWDRFAQPNYNSVILARSGAGKSYLAKLEALRSLYRGIDVAVIDPEDEYARLAHTVGGAHLALGTAGVRVNPFDLDPADGEEALVRRALFAHTLIPVLLGEALDPAERAALDRGVIAAYHRVGITTDPRSFARPAPVLADLSEALASEDDPAARTLAARLAPFVVGSHKGLFDGPTTTAAAGHLVVFSLAALADELKAAGTLLAVDAVWRAVTNPAARKRRLVVVDEAWLVMRDPAGAAFLHRLAKSARKHWCGLTVVTQDAADLLGSELGQAVVANAATQILLRQAPQAIDTVGDAFGLSDGERAFLLAAPVGQGILAAGAERTTFAALASAFEAKTVTTDPAELADG